MERIFVFTINGARSIIRTAHSAREVVKNARRIFGATPSSFAIYPNHAAPSLAGFESYDAACNAMPAKFIPADEVIAKAKEEIELTIAAW